MAQTPLTPVSPVPPVTSVLSSAPPRAKIPELTELDLVLVTARLRLRPFAESDVDDLWPYVSDPALSKMMSWAAHTDRSQTLDFIHHVTASLVSGTGVPWAIELGGRVVGCITFETLQFMLRAWRVDHAELGYWIAPALWGKGMMTEAAHAVLRAGFEIIGLHKVTVGCIAENVGSRRVIEKLGFRSVGRLEDDVWRHGRWWSVLRYELTASEWSDVSTTMRVSRPRP
jgi:RimJ/RimL family protein N-acetyltransferase